MTRASPLFSERIEITGTLVVLTPLHIGSGDAELDEMLPREDGDASNLPPTSARVQIDARAMPWIPGSSLKGAMRALLERRPTDAAALFGAQPGDDDRTMGALTVFGAALTAAPKTSWLPLYGRKNAAKKRGVGLSARTAIDRGRGAADRNQLFHAEEVAPNATFSFRARFVEPATNATTAKTALADLLATLRSEQGLALGRGRGDGAGRVRLENTKIVRRRVDPAQGGLVTVRGDDLDLSRGQPIAAQGETHLVRLACDGPFFVKDWAYERKRDSKTDPQMRALRVERAAPALPATSLMGALRARAEWLVARDILSGDGVEALFGSQDKRGRLRVRTLFCEHPGVAGRPASVRIDRFSGAPMEGALFEIDCVFDPRFCAELLFDAPDDPLGAEEARQVLDALIVDLTRNGLKLGHAANRGFGWFNVSWEQRR